MLDSVKIIAVTKPVDDIGIDEFVAYVARVSNPQNQTNHETAPKLLEYLRKHNHWSPFEMVNIVMEINTTRDIARQILRHRSFVFQEFSQRYADPTQFGFVTREARAQDTTNRQNSIEIDDLSLQTQWNMLQQQLTRSVEDTYDWAISHGIAKEQARVVLPEGLTISRMYMNGTLRSWIHYCELRMKIGTQKEHREIATQCWNNITERFPSLR